MKNVLKIAAAVLLLASIWSVVGCRADKAEEKPSETLPLSYRVLWVKSLLRMMIVSCWT